MTIYLEKHVDDGEGEEDQVIACSELPLRTRTPVSFRGLEVPVTVLSNNRIQVHVSDAKGDLTTWASIYGMGDDWQLADNREIVDVTLDVPEGEAGLQIYDFFNREGLAVENHQNPPEVVDYSKARRK